jgi:hypothetical protein
MGGRFRRATGREASGRPAETVLQTAAVDLQADVFSFGVILYELFVGEITSQIIMGPTGNPEAAEIYAAKVRSIEQLL